MNELNIITGRQAACMKEYVDADVARELQSENAALRDALRVAVLQREGSSDCPECGGMYMHDDQCRHYAVEREVTQ